MLEIIKNADRRSKVPQTAQDTIPFIQMFKDGTCKVTEEYYSKTIEYIRLPIPYVEFVSADYDNQYLMVLKNIVESIMVIGDKF
ncbi:MAG: hypothetical protein K6G72_07660 [Lachnospiraceae bacterium]|nr:hypothetical protein [Lachnospiraceae bacterium]